MSTDLLNKFDFPQVAREDFINKGLVARSLSSSGGAQAIDFQIAGHDKGVAYSFDIVPVKNETKTAAFDVEINDDIEIIRWFVNQDNKPVERVFMLPPELLRFEKQRVDAEGNKLPRKCLGGLYAANYIAWKAGHSLAGLPLQAWGRLSAGQLTTLNSEGVFTTEQYAEMPTDNLIGRFPNEFIELQKEARQFINSRKPMEDVKKYADQVLELKQSQAKLLQEIEQMKAQANKKVQKIDKRSKEYRESIGRTGITAPTQVITEAENGNQVQD